MCQILPTRQKCQEAGTCPDRSPVRACPAEAAEDVDPLEGRALTDDTWSRVRPSRESRAAARAYAQERGIEAAVQEPETRRLNNRPGGHGDYIATDRRGARTH